MSAFGNLSGTDIKDYAAMLAKQVSVTDQTGQSTVTGTLLAVTINKQSVVHPVLLDMAREGDQNIINALLACGRTSPSALLVLADGVTVAVLAGLPKLLPAN